MSVIFHLVPVALLVSGNHADCSLGRFTGIRTFPNGQLSHLTVEPRAASAGSPRCHAHEGCEPGAEQFGPLMQDGACLFHLLSFSRPASIRCRE